MDKLLSWNNKFVRTGGKLISVNQLVPFTSFVQTADAAWSLRKLHPNHTLACRVQRSDLATLDVGFVGNDLDVAAIETFSQGGEVRGNIWYDANGNIDLTTSSYNNSPIIATGGVVNTFNDYPAWDYTLINRFNWRAPRIFDDNVWALFPVIRLNRLDKSIMAIINQHTGEALINRTIFLTYNQVSAEGYYIFFNDGTTRSLQTSVLGNTSLITAIGSYAQNNNYYMNFDNQSEITLLEGVDYIPLDNEFTVGAYSNNDSTNSFEGDFFELILFKTPQLANKSIIQYNQVNYYGI